MAISSPAASSGSQLSERAFSSMANHADARGNQSSRPRSTSSSHGPWATQSKSGVVVAGVGSMAGSLRQHCRHVYGTMAGMVTATHARFGSAVCAAQTGSRGIQTSTEREENGALPYPPPISCEAKESALRATALFSPFAARAATGISLYGQGPLPGSLLSIKPGYMTAVIWEGTVSSCLRSKNILVIC